MKRSRFTEEQIIGILWQAEAGVRVVDLCRQNDISDATFYKWCSKVGEMNVSDAVVTPVRARKRTAEKTCRRAGT